MHMKWFEAPSDEWRHLDSAVDFREYNERV